MSELNDYSGGFCKGQNNTKEKICTNVNCTKKAGSIFIVPNITGITLQLLNRTGTLFQFIKTLLLAQTSGTAVIKSCLPCLEMSKGPKSVLI